MFDNFIFGSLIKIPCFCTIPVGKKNYIALLMIKQHKLNEQDNVKIIRHRHIWQISFHLAQ